VTPRPGIVTPEAVLLEFETAGIGSRTIARMIDLFAQAAAFYVLVFATALASLGAVSDLLAIVLVSAGVLGIVLGYPIAFEALWNGRTPGKATMGLRVVTVEGAPVRFRHAALRAIVGIVDFVVPFGPATGIIAALLSTRTQRLGDMAAGTIVLRERAAGASASAVQFRPFPGWEQYTASLDVAALTAEEYGIVRSFLMRVGQLDAGARGALAGRLGVPVAAKLHHAIPTGVHPEHFLVSVAAAYQQRFGGADRTAPPAPPPPPPPPAFEPTYVREPATPVPPETPSPTADPSPPEPTPDLERRPGFTPPT
jgi:uncharacterized RDD family membrane protein YckC